MSVYACKHKYLCALYIALFLAEYLLVLQRIRLGINMFHILEASGLKLSQETVMRAFSGFQHSLQ